MDLGLQGKAALVTAASKGIGKACALGLAAEGVRVAMCARTASDLAFLASERASYVTGATLQVDGGLIQGLF